MSDVMTQTAWPSETRMLRPEVHARYERDLNRVEERMAEEVRRNPKAIISTPRMTELRREREYLLARLEASRLEAKRRWALANLPIERTLEIIMLPLLADVMTDLTCGVDGMLRDAGIEETRFGDMSRQIRRLSLEMTDSLMAGIADGLPDLVTDDDYLVGAVKKKLMSYIKQRLKLK